MPKSNGLCLYVVERLIVFACVALCAALCVCVCVLACKERLCICIPVRDLCTYKSLYVSYECVGIVCIPI